VPHFAGRVKLSRGGVGPLPTRSLSTDRHSGLTSAHVSEILGDEDGTWCKAQGFRSAACMWQRRTLGNIFDVLSPPIHDIYMWDMHQV